MATNTNPIEEIKVKDMFIKINLKNVLKYPWL